MRQFEALKIEIDKCRKYPPGYFRKNVIFGKGPQKYCTMFIGKDPSKKENRYGRPFVGESGILLGDGCGRNLLINIF